MSFFKFLNIFSNDLAIDLGTANTVIWRNGQVALNQPSVVAFDKSLDKITHLGEDVKPMIGKTHKDVQVLKPMKEGVISDPRIAEAMMRAYINNVAGNFARRVVVCVPAGATESDKIVIRDACERAGAKEVHLITEPMAAAIGLDLDVLEPRGHMIIDIGGGTTEIAIISLGGIVCNQSIKVAGNVITESILQYCRDYHKLLIGEITAEGIKHNMYAYNVEGEDKIEVIVKGRDLIEGVPKELHIPHSDIRKKAFTTPISAIINSIRNLLAETPPDIATDILEQGIWLTGGGALLKGLDKIIARETGLKVHIPKEPNPLLAVVTGTGTVLDNFNKYRSVLLKHTPYL